DFYAHYGPLGFSLQGLLSGLLRNPPLALRLGQAAGLALLAVFAFAGARPASRPGPAAWAAVAFALALSTASPLPSFYGFAFALAALGAFSRTFDAERSGDRAGTGWPAAAGVLLAAAALTRPAFAVYALVAIAFARAALGDPGRRARGPAAFGLAFALGLFAIWAALSRALSPASIVEATVLFPRRLLEGGRRYGEAAFLAAPLPLAYLFTTALACVPLAWTAAI